MEKRVYTLKRNNKNSDDYLWRQIKNIKTDPASSVDVRMIDGGDKSHIGWLKRISAFKKNGS